MVTNKQTEKWNNYFIGLSPEQQRIAIAQDVIAQMKAGKIIPESGTYFEIPDYYTPNDGNTSLQKLLPQITCNVCALGAMFHSHIKYNNKVTYEEYDGAYISDLLSNKLNEYFDPKQLAMIEYAFEGFGHDLDPDFNICYWDLRGVAKNIGNSTSDTVEEEFLTDLLNSHEYFDYLIDGTNSNEDYRMYQIMHNIIRNNGTFVPTDLTIEKWKK